MTPQRGPTLDSAALASVVAFARESAHEGITVADDGDPLIEAPTEIKDAAQRGR